MSDIFDKEFPLTVRQELNARSGFVKNKGVQWNYDKYCYIRMRGTGNTNTIIPAEGGFELGDVSANQTNPIGVYKSEGGIRKFKPQLTGVTISNQGAQDYTDSYIYEVEANFEVYTLEDLNKAEKTYFRVGHEIEFEFGWLNRTGDVNRNTVKASVYNFGFSLEGDGTYKCNIKCISAAALWNSDDMGGTSTQVNNDDKEVEAINFFTDLEKSYRKAFGLKDDQDASNIEDNGNMKLLAKRATLKAHDNINALFLASEINVKYGFWNNDESHQIYTNLDTLIQYINAKNGETNKYIISSDPKFGTYPKIEGIGSADPTKFFLPGTQGSYGRPGGDTFDTNFRQWGKILEENSKGNVFNSDIAKIAISTEYMRQVYDSLASKTETKYGYKQSPKISDFLKEIFSELDKQTGGLITLGIIPENTDKQSLANANYLIVNKKLTSNPEDANKTKRDPYIFKLLDRGSIVRGVSVSSDFDTDLILAATQKNIDKGTSNAHVLNKVYKTNVDTTPKDNAITEDILLNQRTKYAKKGFDQTVVSAYADACRNYILRNSDKDNDLKQGKYAEFQFVLNLSVQIDGIWGIPFLAPITVDRLPTAYKSDNAIFDITGVSHTFDCKGDWETSLETVMRIV